LFSVADFGGSVGEGLPIHHQTFTNLCLGMLLATMANMPNMAHHGFQKSPAHAPFSS
jgi:hypothetical protein